MKNWIRSWLGITELREQQIFLQDLVMDVRSAIKDELKSQVGTHNMALGHILNKLNPMLGADPFDPKRKAESDRLAEETIARLNGEFRASNPLS